MSDHDQMISKINRKAKANHQKQQELAENFRIALDAQSALAQRMLLLARTIEDVPPGTPVAMILEVVIEKILGPIDDDASEERLQFELDWQQFVGDSLEEAHNGALAQMRSSRKPKLIVPKQNGKIIKP